MKNKMKWLGHVSGSIFIAVALFFYASSSNYHNKVLPGQASTTENYSHTLNYVPIEIDYDKDNYYISGFTSTVTVELSGSNRLLLQRETDESSRTFKVKADLTNLEPGTHTVKLEVLNLSGGISASINPSTITVQIGRIAKSEFSVQPVIATSQIDSGYRIEKVGLGTDTIEITADEATMQRIDHVEAVIPDVKSLKADYKGSARIQAVDSQGNVLPVSLSTDETNMEVKVKKK